MNDRSMSFHIPKHQRIAKRVAALELARQPHMKVWKDQAKFQAPYRAEFDDEKKKDGEREDAEIIDSTCGLSIRTFEAGFQSGTTNPNRIWFKLGTEDPGIERIGRVADYLQTVTDIISRLLLQTNLYSTTIPTWGSLSTFSNAAFGISEGLNNGVLFRTQQFPIGSYCFGNDENGEVGVFSRKFQLTVEQLVRTFGKYDPKTGRPMWEAFSTHVQNLWDQGNYDTLISVGQFIEVNPDWNPLLDAFGKFKKYSSNYYEIGCNENKFLEESGFDFFPVICARWQTRGTDPYGFDSPGRLCLGDVKQLQFGELQDLSIWEQANNPALQGPASMQGQPSTSLPGGMNYVPDMDTGRKITAVREVMTRFQESKIRQDAVRARMQRAYYEDIMLRVLLDDRNQRATAQEIMAGNNEAFMVFGTVLQQTDKDVQDKVIEIAYNLALRQKRLPPPPKELQGNRIKIEYVNTMAQAQKALGLGSTERFLNNVGLAAQMDPRVLKKINLFEWVNVQAQSLGVDSRMIRSDDEVAEMEAAEAQAAQAKAAIEMIQQGASAAKDLSAANLDGNNALAALTGGGA